MDKKNIEQYLRDTIRQALSIGIPISKKINEEVVINNRAISRFAACKKKSDHRGDSFSIEIGKAILQCDEKTTKGIIAHEVLHTCYGCQNHGARWKTYADAMNKTFGYEISRTSTYEDLGIKAPDKKRKANYVVLCQKCGNTILRQKRSKLITKPHLYRCKCGGKLTPYQYKQGKDTVK